MSKSEKRYFRLFAASFSEEKSEYLRLFDEMAKTEVYDEKILEQAVNFENLPLVKDRLFEIILKSLKLYYTEQSQYFQIIDAFKNMTILRDKGLIKEAVKIYEKTENQLIELNLYPLLVELLNKGEVLYKIYLNNKEAEEKIKDIGTKKLMYLSLIEDDFAEKKAENSTNS